jgi:hypothetical protein
MTACRTDVRGERASSPKQSVSARLRGSIVRRLRYVARFTYWAIRHGSPKHAGWVCDYEGAWRP